LKNKTRKKRELTVELLKLLPFDDLINLLSKACKEYGTTCNLQARDDRDKLMEAIRERIARKE